MSEKTGLEIYLELDQQYVEATKATEEDELRYTFQIPTEDSSKFLILDGRAMVGPNRYLL